MADNYLEKRMDDLRAGRIGAGNRPALSVSGRLKGAGGLGSLGEAYPGLRVFVAGGAAGVGRALVKAFRDAGCRVAFCDADARGGNATSQKLGARFYNVDGADDEAVEGALADMRRHWGGVDVVARATGEG